ncbi:phage tail protein [Acuticoccus sediminis]|uniref:phage tail protein n=1 Tax=Acuticoccus sediminis TaxID=2184697 RepID=UPI0011B94302|nr:phage tail protein [Acuticoccus sediminis]
MHNNYLTSQNPPRPIFTPSHEPTVTSTNEGNPAELKLNRSLTLKWAMIPKDKGRELLRFFKQHNRKPFAYHVPGDEHEHHWICNTYKVSTYPMPLFDVEANFIQITE